MDTEHEPFERLFDALRFWAAHTPDAEAVVDGDIRLSYAQLLEWTERLAGAMLARGVRPGDRVAALLPPSAEFVASCLAAQMCGAVVVGLNPRHTESELAWALEHACPTLLVAQALPGDSAAMLQRLTKAGNIGGIAVGQPWSGDVEPFEHAVRAETSAENASLLVRRMTEVNPDDVAFVVYTSGSTGRPRGALLSHRGVLASLVAQTERLNFRQGERIMFHLPACHVSGAVEMAMGSVVGGAALVALRRFTPEDTLALVQRERVTFLGQVPAQFVLQLPLLDRYDISSVRTFVWAGAPAPRKVIEALSATGARLITGYGMTEIAGFVTYTREGACLDELRETAGKVHPAFGLRIVLDDGGEAPPGEIGEVHLRGGSLMLGYLDDEEATSAALVGDGWLATGDLGYLDPLGNLVLTGRAKEMYKSGGYNVSPRELEAALEERADVAMACVVPVAHDTFGEVGHAFVVPGSGRTPGVSELLAYLRRRLAHYKVPKSLELRPVLPLLPTGKVDREALREIARGNAAERG